MPKIILQADKYSGRVDEPVIIPARVEGKPSFIVTLMIDGKEVSSSEYKIIKADGDEHSIDIKIKEAVLTPGVHTITITAKNDLRDLDADTKNVRVTVEDGKCNTILKGRPFDSGDGGAMVYCEKKIAYQVMKIMKIIQK